MLNVYRKKVYWVKFKKKNEPMRFLFSDGQNNTVTIQKNRQRRETCIPTNSFRHLDNIIFSYNVCYISSLLSTFTTQSNARGGTINDIFIYQKHKHFIIIIIFSRRTKYNMSMYLLFHIILFYICYNISRLFTFN